MKKAGILSFAVLCAIILTACAPKKMISLPAANQIETIELSLNVNTAIYTGTQIEETLNALQSATAIRRQSVNDTPGVTNAIRIDIFFESGSSRCY